tara:strand:- start:8850 stop:8972 length:123 start_codon:yes stop_codon:yes gene_type:complete
LNFEIEEQPSKLEQGELPFASTNFNLNLRFLEISFEKEQI